MLYSERTGRQFYQSLGKLFYALAMADKNVRPGEVKKLQDDVRTYWLNLDALQDEFGTDAAYQIEIVFDWLKNEEKDSDTYFEEFTDFYKEHSEIFTPNIKSLVIRTCNDIAASFAGKNKSELILLARLQNLFNNN